MLLTPGTHVDVGEEKQALQSALTKEMEGKMKLTLTGEVCRSRDNLFDWVCHDTGIHGEIYVMCWWQEQRAKANVLLPYEKVQSEDVDSGNMLGKIVYYRDSEEDCDSDEDPDDDLDI